MERWGIFIRITGNFFFQLCRPSLSESGYYAKVLAPNARALAFLAGKVEEFCPPPKGEGGHTGFNADPVGVGVGVGVGVTDLYP